MKKEYLFVRDSKYSLVNRDALLADGLEQYIEVPDDANAFLKIGNNGNYFYSFGEKSFVIHDDGRRESIRDGITTIDEFMSFDTLGKDEILWQREKIEVGEVKEGSAWDVQEGGNHYKDLAIQPAQYALANKLDYVQGNIVKYVTRHASKNGKEDLLKAKHYIDLMIEHYYGEK